MFWFGANEYICIFAVTVLEAKPRGNPSYHTTYLEKNQTVLSYNLLGEKSNHPITQPTWRRTLELCYVIYLEKDEIVLLITQQTRRTMKRPIIF